MSKLYFECRFNSFELSSLDLPIEIRKPNIALVTRCRSSQSVELKPGTYYVTTRLPTSQELFSEVQLSEDTDLLVVLSTDSEHHPLNEAQEMHRFLGARGLTDLQIDSHLEPSDVSDNNLPLHRSERLIARLRVYWDYLFPFFNRRKSSKGIEAEIRVFRGNILQAGHSVIPADDWLVVPPKAGHFVLQSSKHAWWMRWFGTSSLGTNPLVAQFSVSSGNEVQLVQLLQPNAPAVNTMLPSTMYHQCHLFLTQFPNGLCSVGIQLANKSADLLLRYLQRGLMEQSTTLINSQLLVSELLLSLRQEDPIAAAVGAYALLRCDDLERLEYFTKNLGDRFEWLPDTVAIRGEYLARIGDDDQALATFIDLPSLPIFSDGLSYAIDRLRLYISLGEDYFENAQLLKAQALLKRLQKFAFFVDFRQPLLTFHGVDPGKPSNDPLGEDMASHGGLDVAMLLPSAQINYRAFIRNLSVQKVVALISAFFRTYGASLVTTGVAIPIVAALATALLSLLPSLSFVPILGEKWYVLLYGALLTGIVWAVLAIRCSFFISAERANKRSYAAFQRRLSIVKAQLGMSELRSDNPTLEDILRAARVDPGSRYSLVALREAYNYCTDAGRRIKETSTGLQWIAGTGYNLVWSLLHRAEEALIEIEPAALVIRGSTHDKVCIQHSSINRRTDLIRVLKQVVADIDVSDKTDDTTAFEDGEKSGSSMPKLQMHRIARGLSRVARGILNTYRDNHWEELVRTRNQLLGIVVITGLASYILLCITILVSNPAVIIEAITIYITGSIAGLIRPLYKVKRRKTPIHDYGFSWAYIIAAGLFAGLASVVGIFIVGQLYVPDPFAVNLQTMWSSIFRPEQLLNLPVAAIFGLVSNLYFRNIRRRVEKIETDLESSDPPHGVLLSVT